MDKKTGQSFPLQFLPLNQNNKLCRHGLLRRVLWELSWKGSGIMWVDTEFGRDAPPTESQDAKMN